MRRRRLTWAVTGVVSCVAVSVALLMSGSGEPTGTQISVPQGQGGELSIPKPPSSAVSVLPPVPSVSAVPPAPPAVPSREPATHPPRPVPTQVGLRPVGVDFQAEDARIRGGDVESDHPGFTGSGFVDLDNVTGSSVEWTVTALATAGADVVFRFANGSSGPRRMTITVNGIRTASVSFPVTDGWADWRTLTVRVNLLAGTSRIKAIAATDEGGPNLDKITLV